MMLEVQELRAAYGRIPILNGISFAVADGEFVGILGHNGMGKTTLLRALMGFLPATSGHVRFEQQDITAFEPFRRARLGLGYVPQGREIFPALTVYDNLRMGCSKERSAVERETIETVLEEFPRLKPLLDRVGGALSGGSSSCLRSRAVFAASRAWCCSTSRPRVSSPRSSTRSSRRCRGCARRAGLPSSWSSKISTSSRRCRDGFSSFRRARSPGALNRTICTMQVLSVNSSGSQPEPGQPGRVQEGEQPWQSDDPLSSNCAA